MNIKNLKYLFCILKGHKLVEPSIINFMDGRNYLCKCERCGLYEAKGELGRITVWERWAMNTKKEFDGMFGNIKKNFDDK